MKILSYVLRDDGYLVLTTDEGVFAYPADKFNNLKQLEKEISKKIKEVKKRDKVKKDKKDSLIAELDVEVNG